MSSTKPFFSVITPVFNGADTIKSRVYFSLLKQSFQDFEWIIIDDGSTDNTSLIIEEIANLAPFKVKVKHIENSHKKTALYHGIHMANGFMTLVADADDWIAPTALKIFYKTWKQYDDKDLFVSVCGHCVDQHQNFVGSEFPESPMTCRFIEMYIKYRVTGDKSRCILTDDLIKIYPDYSHIKGHVPEGIYHRRLDKKKTIFINDILSVCDTSTPNSIMKSDPKEHAEGCCLDSQDLLNGYIVYFKYHPMAYLRAAARLNKYLKYSQTKKFKIYGFIAKALYFCTLPCRFLRSVDSAIKSLGTSLN